MTKREEQARDYAREQAEIDRILDRIAVPEQRAPSVEFSGWVDASNRLPVAHVEVLVCHAGRGRYSTAHVVRTEGRCPQWFSNCGDVNEPTHWMPLPSVPRLRNGVIPPERLAEYQHDAAVHEAIEWAISMADDKNHPAAFPLVALLMRIKGESE